MELVNQTFGQVLLFGSIISSVLVTWQLLIRPRPWGPPALAGLWLLTAGIWMVVFVEEPIPEWQIHLRNLGMVGGTACLWWGCLRFLRRPVPPWLIPAGLAALILMLALAHRVFPGPASRASVFSLHIAGWNAAIAWAFFDSQLPDQPNLRRAAVALFAFNAAINLARAVAMACLLGASDLFIPTALTYFYALLFLILQTGVLWNMADEPYLMDF